MNTNQPTNAQLTPPHRFTLLDYHDRPLATLAQLHHMPTREFEAEVYLMTDLLCTEGSALNPADHLFRLLLLLREYHDDDEGWPHDPLHLALRFTFVRTTPGGDAYDQFITNLIGEASGRTPGGGQTATPQTEAARLSPYQQKLVRLVSALYPTTGNAPDEARLDRLLAALEASD